AANRGGGGEHQVPDATADRRFEQAARGPGIVGIIFERIGQRFRHHDGTGEVDDLADAVRVDQPADQVHVAGIAVNEGGARVDGPVKPGDEIVEDDDLFPGIAQAQYHVAADIAGPAGDQNG